MAWRYDEARIQAAKDKRDAADQREAGAIVRALGGSIRAGLAE